MMVVGRELELFVVMVEPCTVMDIQTMVWVMVQALAVVAAAVGQDLLDLVLVKMLLMVEVGDMEVTTPVVPVEVVIIQ